MKNSVAASNISRGQEEAPTLWRVRDEPDDFYE